MRIRISPLLLVMGLVMFAFGRLYDYAAFLIVVVLHECFHAFIARRLGYRLTCLRLSPSGASLTGEFAGVRLRDEALIAIAGPIFNLVTGVLLVAIWWVFPMTYGVTVAFARASFVTFAINLLPVFPLDGGRVLLAILSKKLPRQQAYQKIRFFGILVASAFFVSALVALFLLHSTSIIFMSAFVLISVIVPDKQSKYTRLYSKAYRNEKLKKGLDIKQIAVKTDTLLVDALKMLNSGFICYFVVLDAELNTVALVDEGQVDNALSQGAYQWAFGDLLATKAVCNS
ncbi:MAG: hypothetical protein FWD76_00710 [Firmicutes bacterium]|nr:hypothetical protein [Bacillota bacterium]